MNPVDTMGNTFGRFSLFLRNRLGSSLFRLGDEIGDVRGGEFKRSRKRALRSGRTGFRRGYSRKRRRARRKAELAAFKVLQDALSCRSLCTLHLRFYLFLDLLGLFLLPFEILFLANYGQEVSSEAVG